MRNLKYKRFPAKVKASLEKISMFLKKNNYTLDWLHKNLDTNKDNTVDIEEFVKGMRYLKIERISVKDYEEIFRQIDVDSNQFLSLNEFKTYLEGA